VTPSYAGLGVNGGTDRIMKMRWIRVCCWLKRLFRMVDPMLNGFYEQIAEGMGCQNIFLRMAIAAFASGLRVHVSR
jgi:hypothetical protein